ncbi:epoxyqueuosine reductase [Intestinibacter bartlettii]|uniref:Epoxyqueuosine reductase n=1 Tax=Intestinibacter bartlettii TaxID=261299 RepID=A0ABS6DZK4_9FIRM|nr:epoxyqueuosine reductase [Intestinibacter bartlettii]MBU5337197.1 epoxyqueuosine reductase [Intestinibacter bartlettii]
MREFIKNTIVEFIDKYCKENNLENIWEEPIVGFADANSKYISNLKNIVVDCHYLPSDYLKNPKIIVSYFLPFKREIGKSNDFKGPTSSKWSNAYKVTNKMAQEINKYMILKIEEKGYRGANPTDIDVFDYSILKSKWSQRHIAYAAGIGTFGINNMLISDVGSCGRYFSIVTDLDVKPDKPIKEERCKYKIDKTCGVCVKKCEVGALTYESFDRFKCSKNCKKNVEVFGVDVCGKCVVELPCSYRKPIK